jgi:hypothetical protein
MGNRVRIQRRKEDGSLYVELADYYGNNLADIMERFARYGTVESLAFDDCELGDKEMAEIAEHLPKLDKLRHLTFYKNFIGPEGVYALTEATRQMPQLQDISFARNVLKGAEGGKAIAHFMANTPGLIEMNVSSNQLGDDGSKVLAAALAKSPNMRKCMAGDLNNTDAGLVHLVNALRGHRGMCSANFIHAEYLSKDDGKKDDIVDVLAGSGTKNLTMFMPTSPAIDAMCKANKEAARKAATHLTDNLEQLDYAQVAAINERWPTIGEYMKTFNPPLDSTKKSFEFMQYEFPQFVMGLPRLPQDNSVDALFATDAKGYAPLDNPRIWSHPAAVFSRFDTLDATQLARTTPRGTSLLDSALLAAPMERLMPELNGRGIQVKGTALVQKDGSATPLFTAIIERGDGAKLFTRANWIGSDASTMRQAANLLPPEQRASIPMYSLSTALSAPQVAKGR